MDKIRADVYLVNQGLAPSRERARGLIQAGLVLMDGKPLTKPSAMVPESAVVTVTGEALPFVSRGGLKLQKAVEEYGLALSGVTAVDVGASTGGFTDCMLQHGAARVYALDVGRDLLDAKLRQDPRVVVMEGRNAREMEPAWFDAAPSFGATDVSFISLRLILPGMYRCLAERATAVALVKPQFEAGRERIGKNGVVRDAAVHRAVLTETALFAQSLGFRVHALDFSPITGPQGNIEFLLLLEKQPETAPGGVGDISAAAAQAVAAAHSYFKEQKASL